MQFTGLNKKPAPGLLFDSDFGRTIDSVLALALLHGLENKSDVRQAAITISNPDLKAAQFCDVVEKFYSSANAGPMAAFFTPAPIGLYADGKKAPDTPVFTAALAKKKEDGKPVFAPRIRNLNDTAIAEVLLRNALTAQYDQNAVVVMAGPSANLNRLLTLNGAKDLISAKVKLLVIAAGAYGSGASDTSLRGDVAGMRKLLAEWPTPVVMCGREVGEAAPYPAASIETDYAYNPDHPIAAAYRAYKTMPYEAPTTDMAAILYAARPKEQYFKLSDPGTVTISDDGKTVLSASASGKHRYLIFDPEQKEKVIKAYTELASAKPVSRVPRRLPNVDKIDDAAAEKTDKPESPEKPEKKEQ